jgi:signal transduction histidine kinase
MAPAATLFHSFFDHAHTALVIIDEAVCIIEANAAARDMLDLPGETVAGEVGLLGCFWQVSATAVMRMLETVRREVPTAPVAARTAGDRLVEVDAFPIDGAASRLTGVIVTDRSSVDDARRRLQDQEERFRSLFEWTPVAMREEDFGAVGVWLDMLRAGGVLDLDDYMRRNPADVIRAIMSIRTTRVNAAMVELLKAPSVLAILRGFRQEELTPQVVESFKAQFQVLWDGGSDYASDFVGVNFRNEPLECRVSWTVPRTSNGRDLSRVAVAILDLTRQRATERRLQRLVTDKDRFLASVSHELRTPLAAVLGLSEELAANWESFDAAEARELIGLVANQSTDLSMIVEDLLVAANLETGKVSITPQIIDLKTIAGDAVRDCARSQAPIGALEVAGKMASAFADPVRVRQIVRNLLTNAVRYGGDELSIEVGSGPQAFLRVVDNGDGIPLEQREAVFVPYFQASGSTNVLGSLGLGLAISRELARRMNGELTYAYRDGLSVFQLDLPAA